MQNELDKVKARNEKQAAGRRQVVLRKLLQDDEASGPGQKFATPVATTTRQEYEGG